MRKITGGILKPKIFNIVYLFFVLFIFIGGYSIYISEDILDKEAVLMATVSIILTMYLLPLGYLFSKVLMKNKSKVHYNELNTLNVNSINRKGLYFVILLIISSCYLYYTSLTNIPLFSAFDSSILSRYDLAESRSNATNNMDYSNKNYLFKLLVGYRDFIQITLLSFVVGYFYLKYKHNKTTVNLIVFLLPLLLLIFNSISTLKKADIIFVLLFLFFVNSYDNYKRETKTVIDRRNILKLFGIGIFSFNLLILIYSLFMKIPLSNVSLIISSIFERVFVSSVKPLYYYFSVFPEYHEHLLGRSFSPTIFGGVLNAQVFNIEGYIHSFIYPDIIARGIVGTAPTIFIGEVYANYGFTIMLISILLTGFIIGYLERILENIKYTYLNVSFYIILAFTIKDISISSIQSVIGYPTIISKVMMFLIVSYFVLHPFTKRMKS